MDVNAIKAEIMQGEKQFLQGNTFESLKIFETVLLKDPDNLAALNNKGVALNKLGRYREAIDTFHDVLFKSNDYVSAVFNLISNYFALGKVVEAENVLEKYGDCLRPQDVAMIRQDIKKSKKRAFPESLPEDNTLRKSKPPIDLVIYGIMRSGTTLLSDLLTVKNHSLVLHEPEILYTQYSESQAALYEFQKIIRQLHNFGFDVSHIKNWDTAKYPLFSQFFKDEICPLVSNLNILGVKLIDFDNWQGFLDTYKPQKLILSVRDIRDVVLSAFDLALRLNRLVVDELWIEKKVIESCQQLVKMSRLPHLLVKYEDLCSDPGVRHHIAEYTGLKELGQDRSHFEQVVPFRNWELEKHGKGVSNLSVYRHRSEPFGPALALANRIWRLCPEYSETFGYQVPVPFEAGPYTHTDRSGSKRHGDTDVIRIADKDSWISMGVTLGQSKRAAVEAAITFIPPGSAALDLSCGTMSLEPRLPEKCEYIPCDVVQRNEKTLICDLNKDILPKVNDATIVVALGCLEYVQDIPKLLKGLRTTFGAPVILSYHPADKIPGSGRLDFGWVNHMQTEELLETARQNGFSITALRTINFMQLVVCLSPR